MKNSEIHPHLQTLYLNPSCGRSVKILKCANDTTNATAFYPCKSVQDKKSENKLQSKNKRKTTTEVIGQLKCLNHVYPLI